MKELRYNLSCRLFTDVKCFGPGVAQLLHRVERLHSLRAAAMEMEMAYSKAWTVIKNSENALGFKLETAVRILLIASAMPIYAELLSLALEVLRDVGMGLSG